jgi:hypothetical protein
MRLASRIIVVTALNLWVCGCSPVTASHCTVYADAHGAPHLRATITNDTAKTLTLAGVFVYTDASFDEYEFFSPVAPHTSAADRSGVQYAPGQNGGTRQDRFHPILSCYARAARYADGSVWSVSPL